MCVCMCLRRVSWQGCCEASINECHAVTSTQLSCVEIDTNTQLNMRQLFIAVVASCCCGECNCTCGWRSLGGSVDAIKNKKHPATSRQKFKFFSPQNATCNLQYCCFCCLLCGCCLIFCFCHYFIYAALSCCYFQARLATFSLFLCCSLNDFMVPFCGTINS